MRNVWLASAAAAAVLVMAGGSYAQTNVEKLGQMMTTGVTEFEVIE